MPLTEPTLTSADLPDPAEPLPAAGAFAMVPLRHLVSSATNPRQHFDAAKLQDLADSIKASGVHQPILVRPLPGHRVHSTDRRVQFEIVSGERRYRASCMVFDGGALSAGTIPAMVRPLTDSQVLEIQLVENLQRADLTELEEAEGYERLIRETDCAKEEVAAKIGKSRSYVYARLKLLDLCTEARQALREGQIDASKALAIARIPDTKLQIKALAEASRRTHLDEPISYREFNRWLQLNVMLQLETARFRITDASLVPAAGSCKECPKRTGANPDLFADVNGKDVCTDPPCFHGKEDAHRAQLLAKAQAKGMRVIEGKEAKEIIASQYTRHLEGYSRLDERRDDATAPGDSTPTLRKLLGKDGPAPVLIEHPYTKELIEAVPTEEAEALLVARGAIEPFITRSKAETTEDQIAHLKHQLDVRVRESAHKAQFAAVVAKVHATPPGKVHALLTDELMRAWLLSEIEDREEQDIDQALNLKPPAEDDEGDSADDTDRHTLAIQRAPWATLQKALVVWMLQNDAPPSYGSAYYYPRADLPDTPVLTAGAAHLGIDLQAIEAEVRAELKAEVEAEIKTLKAQAKAAAQPKPPADTAIPKLKPGKAGKGSKATPAEAAQAIATALQQAEATPTAITVGTRVRVKAGGTLPLTHQKWAAKEGTVKEHDGDFLWTVTFKGRGGGIAVFQDSQLEVVAP